MFDRPVPGRWLALAFCSLTLLGTSLKAEQQTLLAEDFSNPELPGWTKHYNTAEVWTEVLPDGQDALFMKADRPANNSLVHALPADQMSGKLVIVEAMIRAEDIQPGKNSYNCGKVFLSWETPKGKHWTNVQQSDFSGSFGWVKRSYALDMSEDVQAATLRIGLEACTGEAAFSNVRVYTDTDVRTKADFNRMQARVAREEMAAILAKNPPQLEIMPGGAIDVFAGDVGVPRKAWGRKVRDMLLATPEPPAATGDLLADVLARDFAQYAQELSAGMAGLPDSAANDRAVEIAGMRLRAARLADDPMPGQEVILGTTGDPVPVNKMVLGNNINWGEFGMVMDHETGRFNEEFLSRVRPMGINFLRYPGGCNADVFDWREAIGPMEERGEQTYYNRSYTDVIWFGVDEFLRFCEREGITPIITTAFLYDTPEVVAANLPERRRQDWIEEYLETCEDRVKLAADWVEYCNGSVDTPMGKLRAENGHPEPYNVVYWEVGNETWGADPVGSCTAEQYGAAFPRYVEAMKARDPSIKVIYNGQEKEDWLKGGLPLGGHAADLVQFHDYLSGGSVDREPTQAWFDNQMKVADSVAHTVESVQGWIEEYSGRDDLQVIVSEFGMGSRGGPAVMSSQGCAVMVADMVRQLLEHPVVFGANRWCLYENFYFTSVCGPSRGNDRPYRVRPDQGSFAAYAQVLGDERYEPTGETDDLKAMIFERPDGYGLLLINRGAEDFVSVVPEFEGLTSGEATYFLQTTAHALTGTENDRELAKSFEGTFAFNPQEPLPVPPNSVMGILLPRATAPASK
ncbi:MAG: hypothetical protein Q7Q73_14855 [Verrucomicrobiota bacterium JB024]|nr:hypothetical protein [Verrucomicrobiota bacterium JB024]